MKKILLITTAVIMFTAFFAGCKNPAEHAAPAKITITVAGDIHVSLKPEYSFEAEKGKTWRQLKAQAEGKIGKCEENYEPDKWTLTNASGQNLTDDYIFNKNVTVFLVTKQTITPPKPKIVITVAGDEHVTLKAEHTFEVVPGTKWDEIKLLANGKIGYTDGYENKTWKFNNASGAVILDGHQFNENTTVYAESQPITAPPPAQVTITVAGDSHIIHKETNHTFNVNKDETWAHAKALAANKIKYADGYENDTWKLTDELGQDIPDNHQFNADTTVYAVSKKIAITITVAGDENVVFKNSDDRTFTAYYGDTWSALQSQAESKITYKNNHENKDWKLNNSSGESLIGTHRFTADTTVFAESKLKDVKLTIAGDHVDISEPKELIVPYGTKWGAAVKSAAEAKLTHHSNFELKQWRKDNADGGVLQNHFPFTKNMTIYAEAKQINISIMIKSGGHVQLVADPTITKPYGVTWRAIEDDAKTKIVGYDTGFVFAAWKKGSVDGFELAYDDDFEKDTEIYVTTQAVLASVGVKVTPPAGGIIGKDASSYTLPGTDASWKGVFIKDRTVNLTAYNIGKYEVSVKLWNEVCEWAKNHGYLFDFDPESKDTPTEDNQPMANISWIDCIAWCNAYTEMWFGSTDECVYRNGSVSGEVIKSVANSDKAYCDFSKKGYRLPTEAEWEFAARYQDNDNTNAESYSGVYLTNLNSASGAIKPIGFEGMEVSTDFAELCAETAKVAVFNKYYNGTDFVEQSPPVIGRADVGSKDANKLGIHNMSGNVAEWCWDLYTPTVSASTNPYPTGPFPSHETTRVVRGGNWSLSDKPETKKAVYDCMTGKRKWNYSSKADPIRGFRLVWKE